MRLHFTKTMAGAEESDDPEAIEGRMLDQIGLHEIVVHTMDALFRMFLTLRIGAEWEAELTRIQAWVHKARGV